MLAVAVEDSHQASGCYVPSGTLMAQIWCQAHLTHQNLRFQPNRTSFR